MICNDIEKKLGFSCSLNEMTTTDIKTVITIIISREREDR